MTRCEPARGGQASWYRRASGHARRRVKMNQPHRLAANENIENNPMQSSGGRRHGCFTYENTLTRRANQWYYSVIPNFVNRPVPIGLRCPRSRSGSAIARLVKAKPALRSCAETGGHERWSSMSVPSPSIDPLAARNLSSLELVLHAWRPNAPRLKSVCGCSSGCASRLRRNGSPGWIRTSDHSINSRMLYR